VNKKDMKVYSVIPARGGSKRVPKKNIKLLGEFPLIAYSIAASRLSGCIERTIVSTDSEEIAEVARRYGAEVPFLRPRELASDSSTDIDFVRHLLKWLEDNEKCQPEYLVHLRPTTPLREPALIDEAIKQIVKNKEATSLRSAHELRESPYKVFQIVDGFLAGFFPDDPRPEYYNLPSQSFAPAYQPDGYVDILKTQAIQGLNTLHGKKILPFVVPDAGEIDNPQDFEYIEYMLDKNKECTLYKWLKEFSQK